MKKRYVAPESDVITLNLTDILTDSIDAGQPDEEDPGFD